MRVYVLLIFVWVLFCFILVGLSFAASVDLPIRVRIWNLDHEPIHSLAFNECARHGFPCMYQCENAPISDVVDACIQHELCCFRAGPHLDKTFDSDETSMPSGVYQ